MTNLKLCKCPVCLEDMIFVDNSEMREEFSSPELSDYYECSKCKTTIDVEYAFNRPREYQIIKEESERYSNLIKVALKLKSYFDDGAWLENAGIEGSDFVEYFVEEVSKWEDE